MKLRRVDLISLWIANSCCVEISWTSELKIHRKRYRISLHQISLMIFDEKMIFKKK